MPRSAHCSLVCWGPPTSLAAETTTGARGSGRTGRLLGRPRSPPSLPSIPSTARRAAPGRAQSALRKLGSARNLLVSGQRTTMRKTPVRQDHGITAIHGIAAARGGPPATGSPPPMRLPLPVGSPPREGSLPPMEALQPRVSSVGAAHPCWRWRRRGAGSRPCSGRLWQSPWRTSDPKTEPSQS